MGEKKIKHRDNDLIICDPEILMGKPVVKGTRLSVELILEKLSKGESMDDILEAHPRLTKEGIFSALGYASKVMKTDIVEPLPERKHAVRR
jgi:uncharacterized protein (DUF433 family)